MNVASDRHPEPDVLAAFVEGHVTGDELKGVTAHLDVCEECRSLVAGAAEFERETARPLVAIRRRISPWWLAAAAAIITVAVLVPLRRRLTDPFNHVQGDHRAIQARTTSLDYAPFAAMRSDAPEENYRQLAAVAELQDLAAKDRNAENLRRLGVAELAVGHAQSAHDHLAEAAALAPHDARVLSDLGAAEMTVGQFADGAENSARALAIDPTFAPAAFNRALALERLSNRPAAIAAWEKYLSLDGRGGWAEEARKHLGELRKH